MTFEVVFEGNKEAYWGGIEVDHIVEDFDKDEDQSFKGYIFKAFIHTSFQFNAFFINSRQFFSFLLTWPPF